ncbi:MAG: FliH/SctL family protein [Candidatus Kryptoniota bacterium]
MKREVGAVILQKDEINKEKETTVDQCESLEQRLTHSYEEGYRAGFLDGKNQAINELDQSFQIELDKASEQLSSVVRQFSAEVEKFYNEFDVAIVKLAISIARRIVVRELEIDEGAVLARTKEAIRKVIGVEKIKIHVNPSDEEYVRRHRSDLLSHADSVREIVIESDNKVERGGCIIESDLGNIDARLSTQFEIIEEALLSVLRK